ncbi:MAG: hypothetical protein ACYTBJ_00885 [Planctomycetota bacterium]|jgi:hypothetical protein
MEWLIENFEAVVAGSLIFIAAIDKVVLMALKTVRNIMDAWTETFNPPEPPKF